MSTVIHVCAGCKDKGTSEPLLGRATLAAVGAMAATVDPPIVVKGYSCIGNCQRRCRLSITGPGRWTWLIGDVRPERDIPALRQFVVAWLAAPDGLVKKDDRPPEIRPKLLGRVPPD